MHSRLVTPLPVFFQNLTSSVKNFSPQASELRRYLGTMQRDVTKDTDIVEWWQVRLNPLKCFSTLIIILQDNAKLYPTLARIALDVLPSQASSVPCERVFSGSKQIATDRQACLSPAVCEELVIMGSAWRPDLYDMAAWTASQVEEVDLFEFEEMFADDAECLAWEMELDKGMEDIELVV
jgi:hypothetical protein